MALRATVAVGACQPKVGHMAAAPGKTVPTELERVPFPKAAADRSLQAPRVPSLTSQPNKQVLLSPEIDAETEAEMPACWGPNRK